MRLFVFVQRIALRMQAKDPLAALQRAITLLPDDTGVHNNLGNALGQRGRLDDAVASYRRALAQLRAFVAPLKHLAQE